MSKHVMLHDDIEQIAQLWEKTQRLMRFAKPPAPPRNVANLTLQQMRCLFTITHHENCTLGELSTRIEAKPSTASELVERLVRAKFVKRSVDAEDRRTIRLSLTKAGHALHEKHRAHHRAQMREFLNRLTKNQRRAMKTALETLDEIMTQVDGEKSP